MERGSEREGKNDDEKLDEKLRESETRIEENRQKKRKVEERMTKRRKLEDYWKMMSLLKRTYTPEKGEDRLKRRREMKRI